MCVWNISREEEKRNNKSTTEQWKTNLSVCVCVCSAFQLKCVSIIQSNRRQEDFFHLVLLHSPSPPKPSPSSNHSPEGKSN